MYLSEDKQKSYKGQESNNGQSDCQIVSDINMNIFHLLEVLMGISYTGGTKISRPTTIGTTVKMPLQPLE